MGGGASKSKSKKDDAAAPPASATASAAGAAGAGTAIVKVKVPPGGKAGKKMTVTGPDGREHVMKIPKGKKAGDTWDAELPVERPLSHGSRQASSRAGSSADAGEPEHQQLAPARESRAAAGALGSDEMVSSPPRRSQRGASGDSSSAADDGDGAAGAEVRQHPPSPGADAAARAAASPAGRASGTDHAGDSGGEEGATEALRPGQVKLLERARSRREAEERAAAPPAKGEAKRESTATAAGQALAKGEAPAAAAVPSGPPLVSTSLLVAQGRVRLTVGPHVSPPPPTPPPPPPKPPMRVVLRYEVAPKAVELPDAFGSQAAAIGWMLGGKADPRDLKPLVLSGFGAVPLSQPPSQPPETMAPGGGGGAPPAPLEGAQGGGAPPPPPDEAPADAPAEDVRTGGVESAAAGAGAG